MSRCVAFSHHRLSQNCNANSFDSTDQPVNKPRKPLPTGLRRHSGIVSDRVILYCGIRNAQSATPLSTLCLTGNLRDLINALFTRIPASRSARVKVSKPAFQYFFSLSELQNEEDTHGRGP